MPRSYEQHLLEARARVAAQEAQGSHQRPRNLSDYFIPLPEQSYGPRHKDSPEREHSEWVLESVRLNQWEPGV